MSAVRRPIRVGAPVTGSLEERYVTTSLRHGWLARGPAVEEFELRLSAYFDSRHALTTNSGSSALMLAVASAKIYGDWDDGDEVITCALGFPTSISAILLAGLRPIIVDCDPQTLTIDVTEVEKALSPRTRGVLVVHPIGNVANMTELERLAKLRRLLIIEDACDAFGSRWQGAATGSIGAVGALSFYASHHISTGEGGAVLTDTDELASIARSLRAWGRVPQRETDYNRSIGSTNRRATIQLLVGDELVDYDVKFSYRYPGFNLKMPELSAALGCAQMEQANAFARVRADNYETLRERVEHIAGVRLPTVYQEASPSWMVAGLLLDDPLMRYRGVICGFLEDAGIETRPVLAGCLVRQPAFLALKERSVPNADNVMRAGLCVGVHQGLRTGDMVEVAQVLDAAIARVGAELK